MSRWEKIFLTFVGMTVCAVMTFDVIWLYLFTVEWKVVT